MTLTKLSDSVFVFQAPTNIGIITSSNGEAVIIDSGIDESVARKLLREVANEGFSVKAVINTHSHSDHIGGNSFIVSRTGAAIYASPIEATFVENTYLEPTMLVGGAHPWKEMRNKFLFAKPSVITEKLSEGNKEISGINLTIVTLPGHSLDQVGVLYQGVLFSGDAFISADLLQKHGIPYNVDIKSYLESLSKLEQMSCSWYVPAHGSPTQDIKIDLDVNRRTIMKQIELVESWLSEPIELEDLVVKLCDYHGSKAANVGLYFLYRTAVLAYLSYLYEQERAKTLLENNRLLWCR